MKNFLELGLCSELLQAIGEQGYEHPMPVQEEVIPFLLNENENSDLVALAQTGTGKTAAYGLPILQRGPVADGSDRKLPYALVLAPTRELCLQITDDLEGFGKYLKHIKILSVYGGANIEPQIRALRSGIDIVVATPGRLIDLMKRGAADLSKVRCLVLDEADEMLSMGFHEDINSIMEGLPEEHRTLLFSATMSKEIERIANKYLKDKKEIQVGSRNEGAENVNHVYYMVHAKDKYIALKRVVDFFPRIYAIIFCRTRMETQEVADNLIRDGYNADALHGDLSQQQRDLTMQKFRQHRTQLLIATDVAARGLDVDDLTHVINYGMPDDVEVYTHRSGRTGRAGKKGCSICIVNVREKARIKQVEKIIHKEFEKGVMPEPKEICSKQLYHVIDDIERVEVDEEEIAPFMDDVRKRWEWLDKEDLIKRVLSREFGRFLQYYANAPELTALASTSSSHKEKGHKKGSRTAEEGYVRLFLNVGKMDGMYAREVINLINNNVRGDKVEVGRIDLMKNFSFVEVAEKDADRVIKSLKHGVTVKGRSVVADFSSPTPSDSGEPRRATRGKRNEEDHRGTRGKRSESRRRDDRKSDTRKESRSAEPKSRKSTETKSKTFSKADWMEFFTGNAGKKTKTQRKAEKMSTGKLVGETPDFSEEGWARRKPKKK